jgi:acetyl esterase/lipase
MRSLRAKLLDTALPLLGISKVARHPERLEAMLPKIRAAKVPRPHKRWHRKLEIVETSQRGYPVITMAPKTGARPGAPHLFYLHGGGYVFDAASVHFDTVAKLCLRLGASATIPLYPLAPEVKAKEIIAQMLGLYGDLAAQYGAQNITVMGDSAGGGMSLALAQALLADGGPMPGSLVLFSPWLDAAASGEGQAEIERKDRMLSIGMLRKCGEMYRGELPLDAPPVSPLYGPLEGMPRMAIFAGTHDILVVDARRLVARLEDQASDASKAAPSFVYHEYDKMMHVWMLAPIPEGRQALEQTAAFIEGSV